MTDVRIYRTKVGKRSRIDVFFRDIDGRKQCTCCQQWLPEENFRNSSATADRLASQCAACFVARNHGMDSGLEYDSLLELQDGTCGICFNPPPDGERLNIDHDRRHCPGTRSCGKCIRGLLCGKCNRGIGLLGDYSEKMIDAYRYLWGAEAYTDQLIKEM